MDKETYGYTNSDAKYATVCAFRDAAVKDGWTIGPNGNESQETWARLTRGDWVGHVLARKNVGKWKYQAEVSIWAPDKLSIIVPDIYSWEEIQAAIRTCCLCGAKDVDTQRYSFAGRCCKSCRPAAAEKYERGNWTA